VLADAVVAVVADHGESLGEDGHYFGHWDVRFETARVPMLLAHPDGRFAGRTVGELVRTLDLMPTVLDWLDVAAPPDLDGVDLTPLLAGDAAGPDSALTEQSEHVPVRALRTRDWLLVRRDPPQRDPVFRLYARGDGGESDEDVAAAHPDVLARLADALERRYDVADPAAAVPIAVPIASCTGIPPARS